MLEYHGACTIRRDRDNSADPHAVEVLVHGARVGFISRRWSATVAAKIDDHEIEMKCVVNWNGETQNGIYHVKLLPVF
ncbi:MAG: HIRAN domain-containing protein [Ilumatobacteraceae bacterium]